ncbi:MAG: hypothetical protein L6371_06080 [Candidatus Atribacteria bacterium]|nr:hypothetical protein [Candidatus Atribacteria bacterium]
MKYANKSESSKTPPSLALLFMLIFDSASVQQRVYAAREYTLGLKPHFAFASTLQQNVIYGQTLSKKEKKRGTGKLIILREELIGFKDPEDFT